MAAWRSARGSSSRRRSASGSRYATQRPASAARAAAMTRSARRADSRAASSIAGISWRARPTRAGGRRRVVGWWSSGIRTGDEERQPLALRAVDEDPERVVARALEGQVPEVDREGQDRVAPVDVTTRHELPGRARDLAAVGVEEDEPDLVLAVDLGRGHEQPEDHREMRM